MPFNFRKYLRLKNYRKKIRSFFPRKPAKLTSRQVVFITGVGRSGTTALTELLNLHPEICIGIERYKFKFLRLKSFTGDEFTPKRFFTFYPRDTNLLPKGRGHWQEVYDKIRLKYPRARVRGDKIPHLFEQFDPCSRVFPQARWIYMLRDIEAVAASWNARAQNPRDKWPKTSDFRVAVQVWNRANAIVAALPEDKVTIVHYEEFFGGSPSARRRLVEFIGVEESADFTAQARKSYAKYAEIVRTKAPVLLEGQREYIAAHADMKTYRALIARSRRGNRAHGWLAWRFAG